MGVDSLPKTVTRQRRDCDLNPIWTSAPESSTLTTRLPSHALIPLNDGQYFFQHGINIWHLLRTVIHNHLKIRSALVLFKLH